MSIGKDGMSTMAKLRVAGIALALALLPDGALARADSRVGALPVTPPPVPASVASSAPSVASSDRWAQVPGGWGAYRAPAYGHTLPRYWIAPEYYVSNYRDLGLAEPAPGYGWSYYYDDVVLTDQWARIYDWRTARDMRETRGTNRRNSFRRERSGFIGAPVGQAVGKEAARDRGSRYGYRDNGDRGDPRSHWDMGYWQDAMACNCDEEVTSVTLPGQPVVTETVTYTTEYVTVPVRKKYGSRPRHKPRSR